MNTLNCERCRLFWFEAYDVPGTPPNPLAGICPRCGTVAVPPDAKIEEEPPQ